MHQNVVPLSMLATGAAALAGAVVLAAGVPATAAQAVPSAADDTALVQIVNGENQSVTGNNLNTIEVKAPIACDAQATRHVLKITAIAPSGSGSQADIDKWLASPNFYAPTGVNLPGPLKMIASETFQVFADRIGAKIVPGRWTVELRCQNNLGTTIYNRFSGQLTMTSPTSWVGYKPGATTPAPTTTSTTGTGTTSATTTQTTTGGETTSGTTDETTDFTRTADSTTTTGGRDELADTGAGSAMLLGAVGLGLVATGGSLLVLRRRQDVEAG